MYDIAVLRDVFVPSSCVHPFFQIILNAITSCYFCSWILISSLSLRRLLDLLTFERISFHSKNFCSLISHSSLFLRCICFGNLHVPALHVTVIGHLCNMTLPNSNRPPRLVVLSIIIIFYSYIGIYELECFLASTFRY
jgi:hypothetical protein